MRLRSLQTACQLSACLPHNIDPQHLQTRPSAQAPTVPKCLLFPLVVRGRDAPPPLVSTVAANRAGLPRPWAKGSSKATSTASIEKTGSNSTLPTGHTHSFYRRLDCRALLLPRLPSTALYLQPLVTYHHPSPMPAVNKENRTKIKLPKSNLPLQLYHQRTTVSHRTFQV